MNSIRFRSTAILAVGPTGVLPAEPSATNTWRKSQTVSGQSRNALGRKLSGHPQIWESLTPQFRRLASAHSRALRKVGTLSPFFQPLLPALILSTPSVELVRSKIQTASGQCCRRRLRNSALQIPVKKGLISGRNYPAIRIDWHRTCSSLFVAHPPSLWLCHAQMWRVFFFAIPARGGGP